MIGVASPLRFRRSTDHWTNGRVVSDLRRPLDANLGATADTPWYAPPEGYDARRFEMDNGDIALFCWDRSGAYWVGNTETPKALWGTDKISLSEAPDAVTEWAERELLAQLHQESPWLGEYPTLSWFFLPAFLSKDGRETTRAFFRDHAAGFPESEYETACAFYEAFLEGGVLDAYRFVMASKLGTSEHLDLTRMSATMGEFDAAKLLSDAGFSLEPEAGVTTGHSIDYRISRADTDPQLVEVTRPVPPGERAANSPTAAIKDTAATKTDGQLEAHGGGVTLFVDCSSFPESAWRKIDRKHPDVGHRPAAVFWMRPTGRVEGYQKGSVPFDLGDWQQ
jgi:hypothetical protein